MKPTTSIRNIEEELSNNYHKEEKRLQTPAVTGGGSVGECGRLNQSSLLFGAL